MKAPSYRDAIRWVAENDSGADPDALDPKAVSELVSAVLIADVWDVSSEKVGKDIVRIRKFDLDNTFIIVSSSIPAEPQILYYTPKGRFDNRLQNAMRYQTLEAVMAAAVPLSSVKVFRTADWMKDKLKATPVWVRA